jgi:hypothetical protein
LWAVQIVTLIIMQSPPVPCHFLPFSPKYLPQHPILEHPQPVFFPECHRPSFTPTLRGTESSQIRTFTLWIRANLKIMTNVLPFNLEILWLSPRQPCCSAESALAVAAVRCSPTQQSNQAVGSSTLTHKQINKTDISTEISRRFTFSAHRVSRDSSVSIVRFLFSKTPLTALGPNHPTIQ